MNQIYQQELFLSSAPRRPYCTDDFAEGIRINSASQAIKKRYIQHNPPNHLSFLVFDLDRPGALVAAYDAGLPEPSWIAENKQSRRGHLAYAIKTPIITSDAARIAPIRYAAAIQKAYCKALDADSGYAGLLTKTPGHKDWHTAWGPSETYTLDDLAEYVKVLPRLSEKKEEATGLSRNVCLFNDVRKWAYRARLRFSDANEWHKACLDYALKMNQFFPTQLPSSEVKATAKSIAKWCWQRFNAAEFSKIQSARRSHGNKQKGIRSLQLALEIDNHD